MPESICRNCANLTDYYHCEIPQFPVRDPHTNKVTLEARFSTDIRECNADGNCQSFREASFFKKIMNKMMGKEMSPGFSVG